jgi:hypothetical protein
MVDFDASGNILTVSLLAVDRLFVDFTSDFTVVNFVSSTTKRCSKSEGQNRGRYRHRWE